MGIGAYMDYVANLSSLPSSSCMVGFDSQLEYEPQVSSLLKLELEGLVLQQTYQSASVIFLD